ncbi:MAG: GNAT family N-acetyltransferase [Dehalococcoidia bacterium]
MNIRSLTADDEPTIAQAGQVLFGAMRGHTLAWPDLSSAVEEVRASVEEERISLVAMEAERVVGWIAGERQYDGNVYELHPLAVAPEAQGRGIGRALVEAFEAEARAAGARTIWLGTDDEDGRTSLAGRDLYPDPLAALSGIQNLGRHPFEFYLRCGFVLTGVLPDANGPGKPDILMVKRIAPPPTER